MSLPTLTSGSPLCPGVPVDPLQGVLADAGAVTACLVRGDTLEALEAVERVNPVLAGHLRSLMDSVMALDVRTGFMAASYPHAAP